MKYFEMFDDFVMEFLETAKLGWKTFDQGLLEVYNFTTNLFWAFIGLLIILFAFPLWLIGKLSADKDD